MKKIIFAALLTAFICISQSHGATADTTVPVSIQQMQLSFAPLVKKSGPAVVNIYAKHVVQEQTRTVSPFLSDPFFNQFFNAPEFGGSTRERIEKSLGSGVVVGADGVIATNHHVIKDATEISVVM